MTAIEPMSWPDVTPRPGSDPPSRLRLAVTRPGHHTAIITAKGELDASTAPRLAEVVLARLRGTLCTVVIDLSTVDFLAAAGVSVLVRANLLARNRNITLRIVTGGNPCVTRALAITRLARHLPLAET